MNNKEKTFHWIITVFFIVMTGAVVRIEGFKVGVPVCIATLFITLLIMSALEYIIEGEK